MDIAQLGIEVDTTGAARAPSDLDRVAAASLRADAAADELAESSRRASTALSATAAQGQSVTAAATRMAGGFNVVSLEAEKAARSSRMVGEAADTMGVRVGGSATAAIRNISLQLNQVTQQAAVTGDAIQALSIQLPDMLLSFGTFGVVLGVVAGALGPMAANALKTSDAFAETTVTLTALSPVMDAVSNAASAMGDVFGSAFTLAADNLDRIVIIAGTAAALFAGRYVASMAAARIATLSFAGSLVALRTALIRTGIGVLVVGAGELVFQFSRLVQATGGWGAALSLLGDVARGVWSGIVTSAGAIPPALNGVWLTIKAHFQSAIADMVWSWRNFLQSIANGAADLERLEVLGTRPFEGISAGIQNAANNVAEASNDILESSNAARAGAKAAFDESGNVLSNGFEQAKDAASRLSVSVDEVTKSLGGGGSPDEGGGGGKGAAGAAKKAADEIENFASTLRDAAQTADEFGAAQAQSMISGINGISSAWADWLTGGEDGFKGMVDGILSSARKFIADLIAQLTTQRILIPIALSVTGAGAAGGVAAQATGALGGGNGILGAIGNVGGLLGGLGSFGSVGGGLGLLGGTGFLGGLGNALSGPTLLSGITNVGAASTLAGGGIGATIGAALPIVGIGVAAIAGLSSILKKETKVVNEGLRIIFEQEQTILEEFTKTRTASKYGAGEYDTTFREATGGFADELRMFLDTGRDAITASARALGNEATPDFHFGTDLKFKGMSEAEQQAAISQALDDALSTYAQNFLTGSEHLIREGETAAEALTRMGSALQLVNPMLEQVGHTLFDVSLAGGDMASQLAEFFGGADAMSQALGGYIDAFYSEQEQLDMLTRTLTAQMEGLGLAVPATRDEFRALVDSFDLTTEAGREAYATTVQLAGGFDEIYTAAEEAARAADEAANAIQRIAVSAQALNSYRTAFLADEERAVRLTADLTAEMRALGLAMPESRDAFAELVDGIDRTTDAGHNLWATLIGMSGQFDGLYQISEAAAEALRQQEEATRAAEQAARDAALAEAERAAAEAQRNRERDAEEAARLLTEALEDALRTAESDLRAAFAAEQDRVAAMADAQVAAIREATELQVAALRANIDILQDRATEVRGLERSLLSAVDARRVEAQGSSLGGIGRASAFLQSQAASGRLGDVDVIQRAMDVVSQADLGMFDSVAAYQHEQNKITVAMDKLGALAGEEATTAEQQLEALAENVTAVENAADAQVLAIEDARDAQVAALADQLDGILGVARATLSVRDAIDAYATAQANLASLVARSVAPAIASTQSAYTLDGGLVGEQQGAPARNDMVEMHVELIHIREEARRQRQLQERWDRDGLRVRVVETV